MSDGIEVQEKGLEKQDGVLDHENEALAQEISEINDDKPAEIQEKKDEKDTSKAVIDGETKKSSNGTEAVTREEKISEILALKSKMDALIGNIRDTRQLCHKYENENQYLQDYVGSLMKSGEMK